jgi:hypothetical protein
VRRIRETGETAVIAKEGETEVRGWRAEWGRGVAFFNIETLLSLLFYFLIGERITEKEGLETFIKRDYKVYTVRHYITSKPLYHSEVCGSSAQAVCTFRVSVICQT